MEAKLKNKIDEMDWVLSNIPELSPEKEAVIIRGLNENQTSRQFTFWRTLTA